MLNCHIKGLEMLRFMRFLRVNFYVKVNACVKDLTNIKSGRRREKGIFGAEIDGTLKGHSGTKTVNWLQKKLKQHLK